MHSGDLGERLGIDRAFELNAGEAASENLPAGVARPPGKRIELAEIVLVHSERDDALATAASKFRDAPEVEQVVICSPDKDLCQCVRGNDVVTLDRRREIVLDAEGVRDKFGVSPESIPDYLALVGDTADGSTGIARWGAKSAATVLRKLVHLEHIADDSKEWGVKVRGGTTLAKNLREQREDAILYRKLATLRTDVPIHESLEEFRWKGADRPALEALCEELGERALLDRI